MSPSMKCYQCGQVKRCRMVLEEPREGGKPAVLYLCRPCQRELGYLDMGLEGKA